MNCFFVIVVAAAVFGTSKSQEPHNHGETFKQTEVECANEKNVTMEALTQNELGIFTEQDDNSKLNCYTECLFYKLGLFAQGTTDPQMEEIKKLAKINGGDKHVEIAENCVTSIGSNTDACVLSYQLYKCFNIEVNKSGNAPAAGSSAAVNGESDELTPVVAAPSAVPNPLPNPSAFPAPAPAP